MSNYIPYKFLLVGPSGRGKTYSFRNMDKERTLFINVENKPLPFLPGFTNTIIPQNSSEVLAALSAGSTNPNIDAIIVDSFSAYVDLLLSEARITKRGFDIWNHYNENIGKFNTYVKNVRKEVFVTGHSEIITDELGGSRERRLKVKGKEWEGTIEKDYTIVMYTDSKPVENSRPFHFFKLINDGTDSTKVPPGIFPDDQFSIENDSNLVLTRLKQFIIDN